LHHFAEASGFDLADKLAGRSHKIFVKWFGNLGLSSVAPRRSQATAHIAVKRKLRNDKHGSSHFIHGDIHASIGIVKDSERHNLFGQILRIVWCVVVCYAQQNDETLLDLADNLFFDLDRSARDALNYRSHLIALASAIF